MKTSTQYISHKYIAYPFHCFINQKFSWLYRKLRYGIIYWLRKNKVLRNSSSDLLHSESWVCPW